MSITSLLFAVFCISAIGVYWLLPARFRGRVGICHFSSVCHQLVVGISRHFIGRGYGELFPGKTA